MHISYTFVLILNNFRLVILFIIFKLFKCFYIFNVFIYLLFRSTKVSLDHSRKHLIQFNGSASSMWAIAYPFLDLATEACTSKIYLTIKPKFSNFFFLWYYCGLSIARKIISIKYREYI